MTENLTYRLTKIKKKRKSMKSNFTKLSLAEQDKSKTVKFTTDAKSGVTVCRLYDRWWGRTFIGVTRCHDVDTFDEKTGRAIAFNKARRKELLSDIAFLNRQRERLTKRYEQEMRRIDKNEGLKRIYLAGVNDELNELMGNVALPDEAHTFDDWACEGDDDWTGSINDLLNKCELTQEEEIPEEIVKGYKLTQFANFTETEL